MYKIVVAKAALKDFPKLTAQKLDKRAKEIINLLKDNPYQNPPQYEKLIGDLEGMYSRRINIKHRIVYQVNEKTKTVKILSVWSHYEK